MAELLDASRDLRALAELAAEPASLDATLERALDALASVVPYDLAAVLTLDGDALVVRTARGPLATAAVRRHRLPLARFPTIRKALERRRPVAMTEADHAGDEGDPYGGVVDLLDGHSCMVVPLFAGQRLLGAMTLDRRVCEPYPAATTELAGVYGQLVALAMLYAEQAALLDRHRRRLEEQRRTIQGDRGSGEAADRLKASQAPAMRRLIALLQAVAPTPTAVLVQGETGAGKELVAQALHAWSDRADGPFVTLNCAAIPENLVESELFGHVAGAFSGARGARSGRFLVANGGTLLLDEIGDLPLAAQAKLLRVLQEGTFEPVGADRTVRVDVRVVAATHVDLEAAVRQGAFREDLYFRLAVFPVRVPPLRERLEDVVPIAASTLERLARRGGRGPWTLSGAAQDWLRAQPWPGNVRQLVAELERATILRPRGELGVTDLGARDAGPAPRPDSAALPTLAEAERLHIEAALERCGGRIYGARGAAAMLDVKPSTLQSRMKKLGVRRPAR